MALPNNNPSNISNLTPNNPGGVQEPGWGPWLRENAPELSLLAAFLPFAAYVLSWTISTTSDLSILKDRLSEQKSRVDKIADALPSLRVKLAQEELSKNYSGLLLTTAPIKRNGLEYLRAVSVDKGNRFTVYKMSEKKLDYERIKFMLVGFSHLQSFDTISLEEIRRHSLELDKPISLSYTFAPDASFALTSSRGGSQKEITSDFVELLARTGFKKEAEGNLGGVQALGSGPIKGIPI